LFHFLFFYFNHQELTMFKSVINAAALATVLAATISAPVAAQEKEKCYGISAVGKNDCANLAGTHSCAGQSKLDKDLGEWKYVAKGECATMKGHSKTEAEAKIKEMAAKKA
jgi:uncharacterized membrane protein